MHHVQDIELPVANGVLLRQFAVADAKDACAFEFDTDVKRYLWLPKKSKAEWIKAFTSRVETATYPAFAIAALPESTLAGRASINARIDDPHSRELEIVVAKGFWGRGLGRIVADMLVRCAFKKLDAQVLTATVHPDNSASLDLLQAFKFVKIGTKGEGGQIGHLLYERRASA